MTRRRFASATLVAALCLSVLPGAAAAQDAVEPADEDVSDKSVSGIISEGADGLWYITPDEGDPIALSFGPSWFNDIGALFGLSSGDAVTVGGNVRDGMPNENASSIAKDPIVKVLTIGGEKRAKGRPPWAGGPKDVGEAHPGHEGWSKGQAAKTQKEPPGQAKKATGEKVPPGQAKKDAGNVPPGLAKKATTPAGGSQADKPGKGPKPKDE